MKTILKTFVFLALIGMLVACAPKAAPAPEMQETPTAPEVQSTPAPETTPAETAPTPAETSSNETANATAEAPQNGKIVQASIEGNAFKPTVLFLNKGDSVTWTNKDAIPHTATGPGFDTGIMQPNESKTISFNKTGSFTYACTIHPNMKGKITVK